MNGGPGLFVTREQGRENIEGSVITLRQRTVDMNVPVKLKIRNYVQLMAGGVDGDPGALVIKEQESTIDQDSVTTPPLGQED